MLLVALRILQRGEMYSLVLLVVVLGILVYVFLKRHFSSWERIGVKQLETHPLLGSLADNFLKKTSIAECVKAHYDAFKGHRYFGMYQLQQPLLVLRDPELIKTITVKDFDSFTDHQFHSREDVDVMWSKNVISLMGEKWHDMRSTLSPAFTASKMRFMFPLITDCAESFVDFFISKNEDIVTLEMKDTFTRATNDMIASCAFGVQCDSLRQRDNDFYIRGRKAFDFSTFSRRLLFLMFSACPGVMKLFGLKIFTDEISNFFRAVISETIALREDKDIVRPDMIHLLLQARKGTLKVDEEKQLEESFATTKEYSLDSKRPKKLIEISDDDITAQALVFFFGGFDTSSYLMTFIAYELAVNPDIQDRLRVEVEEAFKSCGGKLTYDALQKMEYLDMVVTETLRKWPVAIITDRLCGRDYTIEPQNEGERPVKLKKGSIVWLPIFGIHRDPEYYPNPEKFDPERFNAQNRDKINKYTYLPFGSGPRNCIGSRFALMENKTTICFLLKRFEIVPVKKTQIPLMICKKNLGLTAKDGVWLGFKRRTQTVQ